MVFNTLKEARMNEPLISVEFQMSMLLFVSPAGDLAASRICQPAMVGVIIIGLFIGPSFLNLISYNIFIKDLAAIGAVSE